MLDVARFLPNQHDVNAVIDADGEDETEREYIEQIQVDVQQFHRSDHRPDAERECDNLNQP